MRRTDLKEALEVLVDRTGRVEDMLEALASIYRERARHPEYADPVLHEQMRATAHVLHEASEAVAAIFGADEDAALERAAGRAAYQEAHEEGRGNPSPLKLDALQNMVRDHERRSAQEEARWGKPLSRPEPKTYAQLAEYGLSRADVHALESAGLLRRDVTTHSYDQRTGLFGRGHRKTQTQYAAIFRLTEEALDYASTTQVR